MPSSRKRRLPRLSVATFSGTPRFRPKKAGWKSIEEAYETTFTREQKRGLTEIALAYFRAAPFEMAAPFAGDALSYVEKATRSARAFLRALRIPHEELTREAVLRVRDLIEIAAPSLDIAHLESLTSGFALTCDAAKKDLEQQAKARIEEGQAWNELICSLTEFAKKHDLPFGASKGSDKSKPISRPSRFVAFVLELQKHFPEGYRHPVQSVEAFAWAIGEARKQARERISRPSQN